MKNKAIKKKSVKVPKEIGIRKNDKFIKGQRILSLAKRQLLEEDLSGAVGGSKNQTKLNDNEDEAYEIDEEIEYESNEEEELDESDAAALELFYPREDKAEQLEAEESLMASMSRGADLKDDDREKMPPPETSRVIATGKASGGASGTWISIGDLLRERVTDARSEIESQLSDLSRASSVISPEMKETFVGLRQILANYTHGQFPKILKQLPHMRNCQDVVEELQPERWSSGAMAVMTKFFVAKGGEVAAYFFTDILLPRIRDHISEYGKLNPTLIDAFHRALFVTKVFFTSFLMPLIQDRHHPCTLAEATTIAGLLKKARVNPKYGGAALYLIVNEPYTPAQVVFIRTLLDKNYCLLDPILERVHAYFMRFTEMSESLEDQYFTDENRMPVLWFQALLVYAQNYKDFWSRSPDKCKDLLKLCRVHKHPQITNAIRHEILTATRSDNQLNMDVD